MEANSSPTAVLSGSFDAQGAQGSTDTNGLQLDLTSSSAALGVAAAGSGSESGTGGSQKHPNIFVRGLPLAWSEPEITAVFQQYGILSSIRLVRHSVTKQSLGYGFVRYQEFEEANAAINALDGTSVLGHTLQVKFADADAGPPSSGAPSGLTPSDSCYVKHLPAVYGVAESQQLFEVHGAVLDVKLFPCLDQFRGASALVRMASIEAADRAINSLNNTTPPGGMQPLIVRFAESSGEKAARLSRRERQQFLQRNGFAADLGLGGLDQMQLQQAMAALGLSGMGGNGMPNGGGGAGNAMMRANSGGLGGGGGGMGGGGAPPQYQAAVQSSICVKGMPSTADRLWLYENFARFGAIVGMRILIDEQTGLCNGTAFINYGDPIAAQRARQSMSGMRAGDNIMHVVVQQQQQQQQGGLRGINNVGGNHLAAAAAAAGGMGPAMQMGMNGMPVGGDQGEWQHLLQQQQPNVQHNMVW